MSSWNLTGFFDNIWKLSILSGTLITYLKIFVIVVIKFYHKFTLYLQIILLIKHPETKVLFFLELKFQNLLQKTVLENGTIILKICTFSSKFGS